MKVAIIGAGNVGKALASSITQAGHEVVITSRDAADAASVAAASGATTAPSSAAAAESSRRSMRRACPRSRLRSPPAPPASR